MKSGRHYLVTIIFLSFTRLNSQTAPSEDWYLAFEYLETISSYGAYEAEDSSGKAALMNGIQLCTHWLDKDLDSFTRSEFLYQRGRLYCKKLRIDSARIDLEEALALNIRNLGALDRLSFLASAYLKGYRKRKGYINMSVAAWKTHLGKDSTNAYDWMMMAKAYGFQRDFNLAHNDYLIKRCYYKCIQLDTTNAEYFYELSFYLEGKAREDMLRRALSIHEYWLYRSELVALYAYTFKKYPEAIQLIDESIAMYEQANPVNYMFLGSLYYYKAEVCKSQKKMDLYKAFKAKSKAYYDMD